MKNHSRSFGGNKNGPGFRTPSRFRASVQIKKLGRSFFNQSRKNGK